MLSNILKSMRHVHYSNVSFYDELGRCLPRVKPTEVYATLNDFANIASAYSSLRIVSSEMFTFVGSSVRKLAKDSNLVRRTFRTKDLCRLIWSFGLLCEPLDNAVCEILVDKLQSDTKLAYRYPEVFVESLVALAMNRIYPERLLDVLFSPSFLKVKSSWYITLLLILLLYLMDWPTV